MLAWSPGATGSKAAWGECSWRGSSTGGGPEAGPGCGRPRPQSRGPLRASGDRQLCSAPWQRATLDPRAAGPPCRGGRRLRAPQLGAGQRTSVGRARPEHGKETPPAGPRAWEACGRCVPSLCGPAKAELRFPELVPGTGWGLPSAGRPVARLPGAGDGLGPPQCERPVAQLPGCYRNGLLLAEQSSFEPGPYLGLR